MSDDRTVHALSPAGDIEIVRYDRAGKWYAEAPSINDREPITVNRAAEVALIFERHGGKVFRNLPGGNRFDHLVKP